jgi:hypothetical protein
VLQAHIYGTLHTPAALPKTLSIEYIEFLSGTARRSDWAIVVAVSREVGGNDPVAHARASATSSDSKQETRTPFALVGESSVLNHMPFKDVVLKCSKFGVS